jgi:uncharacterized protein (TIGR02284 family)
MSATNCQLSDAEVGQLQNLIQASIDSRDGFSEAAKNLKPTSALATVFSRLARQRGIHVEEMQDLVAESEELPQHTGSFSAAAHRVWMDLRAAFGGGEQALLEEALRGEDYLLKRYEETITGLEHSECVETLRRQFAAVTTSREKLDEMLDRCHTGPCA